MLHRQAVEFRRFKQQILSMFVMPSILLVLVGVWVWLFVSRVVPSLAVLLGGIWVLKEAPVWIQGSARWLENGVRWLPLLLVLLILFFRWNWIPLQLIQILKGLQLQVEAGIPLVRAIEVLGRSARNRGIRRDLLQATRRLQEGVPVPEVLAQIRIFPSMGQPLLAVGDAAGRLPEMLDFLVQEVQEDLLEQVHRLTILIRHLVLLITGILVGGIVVVYFSLIFSGLSHLPEAITSSQSHYLPAP
jgi:type II secretory pathway component PulF